MNRVDPYSILERLNLQTVRRVTAVRGGSDTGLWRVECRDRIYALRVFPQGRADQCRREVEIMRAAVAARIPVPAVQAATEWREHAAMLLDWCPGRTVAALVQRRPWRTRRLGYLFGATQAAIHRIAAPAALDETREAWIAWAADPALEARLRVGTRQGDRLLHLDYHPLNVMTDGHRITGVLDWTNAQAGDPRADAARTIAILRLEAATATPVPALMRAVVTAFENGWRAGYFGGEHTEADASERALFYAWAGAVMERDLASKRGPRDLARIHRWTEMWARLAGAR